MNVDNLERAMKFFASFPPALNNKFDMDQFVTGIDLGATKATEASERLIHGCGTAGCAVGWTPWIPGIPSLTKNETFADYSQRVYGFFFDGEEEKIGGWLFSSEWQRVDNTPQGVAQRILYLLKYGDPPEDFDDELFCDEDIAYRWVDEYSQGDIHASY